MRVIWVEEEGLQPAAGHGADFATDERPTSENTIAVVRGFEWLHGSPETIEVLIRPPDDRYPATFLADARQVIEEYLKRERDVVGEFWARGWLTPDIYVWLNC